MSDQTKIHPNALPGDVLVICDGYVIMGAEQVRARKEAGESTASAYIIERPDGVTIEEIIAMFKDDSCGWDRTFVWKQ